MTKNNVQIWRLLNPVTDFPAILAILLGLSIAIFLDQIAIKLIGWCVTILGGVALFMLLSQRVKDFSFTSPKPVSEQTSFKTTVKQDPSTKRLIFDDFADSFGDDDFEFNKDSREGDAASASPSATGSKNSTDLSRDNTQSDKAVQPSAGDNGNISVDLDALEDFDDGESGLRIVGPSAKTPITDTSTDIDKASTASPPAVKEQVQAPIAEIAASSKVSEDAKSSDAPHIQKRTEVAPAVETATKPSTETVKDTPAEPETTQKTTIGHKRKQLNIQLTEIFEETPDTLKNEPRKEFDYLISRVLMVIRSAINARTTAFLWVNFDKEELVLESKISDRQDSLQTDRKLPIGSDVVSQIALNGTPEILTEINPQAELDLIPYYARAASTRSFVGVPVFFNNTVVGILAADSTEEDAYDSVTVSFLGHFTKLISGLIQGYTEKYDLLQSARALQAIDNFRHLVHDPKNTKRDICYALVESAAELTAFTAIGVCTFDDTTEQWYVGELRTKRQEYENLVGQTVDLDRSLLGLCITQGETIHNPQITDDVVRISDSEPEAPDAAHWFIPLKSTSRSYGAIFVETPKLTPLTQQDIQILETLAEYTGSVLEQMHLNALIQSHSLVDESTGVMNRTAFLNRLEEEFLRAVDMQLPFTVCLTHIDQYQSMTSNMDAEFAESIANHVISQFGKHLRRYDCIGRLNGNIIGIGLVQKSAQEAQLWAERVRKAIASSVVEHNARQFSVTISAGVAGYASQQSLQELITQAEKALDNAVTRANVVSVFA